MLVCLCFKVFLFSGPKPFKFQDLFCTMKFSRFRCAFDIRALPLCGASSCPFQRQLHYFMQTIPLCQHLFRTFFKKFFSVKEDIYERVTPRSRHRFFLPPNSPPSQPAPRENTADISEDISYMPSLYLPVHFFPLLWTVRN